MQREGGKMEYDFLVDTYETERLKTLGVWSTFKDDDLTIRPHPLDKRDRNALEHMVHQCLTGLSETNPPLSLLCLKFNGLCREPCRTYPIRPQFIPQGCKIIAKFIIFRLTCRTYHVWYLHAASI